MLKILIEIYRYLFSKDNIFHRKNDAYLVLNFETIYAAYFFVIVDNDQHLDHLQHI